MNQLIKRGRTLLAAGLAAAGSFAAVAVAAPVVLGQVAPQTDPKDQPAADNHGPVTPRTWVAAGSSREYGRYEIVASEDKNGDPCVGVRFDDPPPRVPQLFEGCGSAEQLNNAVGYILNEEDDATLFFGRVSDSAASVYISARGTEKQSAAVLNGRDNNKYVLVTADGQLSRAEVTVKDESGRSLGRVDPAAASAR